jgi:hypothetical protein
VSIEPARFSTPLPYHNSRKPHRTIFVDNYVQQPRNNRAKALSGAACDTVPAKQAMDETKGK